MRRLMAVVLSVSCRFRWDQLGHSGFDLARLLACAGQGAQARAGTTRSVVLKPARVWDGLAPQAHEGWIVVVRGEMIEAAGPAGEVKVPEDARAIELPGTTLLPGLDRRPHSCLAAPVQRGAVG